MNNEITVAEQLDTVGVVALLPGELSHERVHMVADALLAAPILAVEIVPNGASTLDTVEAFRKRAGDNMIVGAGRVESAAQLTAAINAGAQFASSTYDFHLPLMSAARKQNFLYIPTVHAPGQALVAYRGGSRWQKIRDDIDAEGMEGMQERLSIVNYGVSFIINQLEIEHIEAGFEAGAKLVCVNDIYVDENQPMGDIITRAREARRKWLAISG